MGSDSTVPNYENLQEIGQSPAETRDPIEDRIIRLFSQNRDQDDEISFLFSKSDNKRDTRISEHSKVTKQEMNNTIIPIFVDCLGEEQIRNDALTQKFELQKQSLLALEETVSSLKLQLRKIQEQHNADNLERQQQLSEQSIKLLNIAAENAQLREALRSKEVANRSDSSSVRELHIAKRQYAASDVKHSFEKGACTLKQSTPNRTNISTKEEEIVFVGWKHNPVPQKKSDKKRGGIIPSGLNKFEFF